jgi:hypothetical protein
MLRTALCVLPLLLANLTAAGAQSRVYVAATTAVDAGERGSIPGGAVPSVGALAGIVLTDAWSIEVEIERGFRTTTAGSGEAVLVSLPPTRNPTREEIELYGIRTRDERTQNAGAGWAAHALWRSRDPGRLNVGVLAGVSSRVYTTELVRTTTFVSPLLNLPPTYRLPDERSARRMVAGGLSGGVMVLVRITPQLTLAPEFRATKGLITDDPYAVFRAGLRTIVRF